MDAPEELLQLHIAWDPGALFVAEHLSKRFEAPLHRGEYSRLVVDLNRTVGNSRLIRRISDGHCIPFNRGLTRGEIERRIVRYYRPYRRAVGEEVAAIIGREGRCIHLSIHSFTPELQGKLRLNDIGLMYDRSRLPEAELVRELRTKLAEVTGLTVWLNRPYSGTADGIMPRIREAHSGESYVAIELEVNQKHAHTQPALTSIAESFGRLLETLNWIRAPEETVPDQDVEQPCW
jgi:predicted N-formylglutamate amidohydrolase